MKGSECVLRLLGASDAFGGTKSEPCYTKIAFVWCMHVNETSGRNERSPRKLWHQLVLLALDTPLTAKAAVGKSRHHGSKMSLRILGTFLDRSQGAWKNGWCMGLFLADCKVGCGKNVKWLRYSQGFRKSDYEVSCKKQGILWEHNSHFLWLWFLMLPQAPRVTGGLCHLVLSKYRGRW